MDQPLITIAICTWNRADLLRQTLERLASVKRPRGHWDIVVVDNNSTDNTAAVVQSFSDRLPIRRVFEPVAGLSTARNCAIDGSTGAYIAFIDDDVLVDEQWLVALECMIEDYPDAAVVSGPVAPWWPQAPDPDLADVFWRLKIGFCGVDHGTERGYLARGLPVVGANLVFSRAKLGSIRFDPQLGRCAGVEKGDDENDVIARVQDAGGDVAWCPDLRVLHYVDPSRMTLAYLRRITEGDGRTAVRKEGLQPDGRSIRGVPRWWLRRCATLRLQACICRLTGKRRRYLELLRMYSYLRGKIVEGWAMYRDLPRGGTPSRPLP